MLAGREHPRVAIVGGGRSRNGLGPFLARALEAAGANVVATVGRTQERAVFAAAELIERLGHTVHPVASLDEAVDHGADTVVIASPSGTHLSYLEWCAVAEADTLCEKPIVDADETDRLDGVLEHFERSGATLWENCQWPQVLDAYWALVSEEGVERQPVQRVELGLSPIGKGRPMLEDSLSHLLSLVQAVAREAGRPVDGESVPQDVQLDPGDEGASLRFRLEPHGIDAALHLCHCAAQPRPAWLALDGRRADRSVEEPGYHIYFGRDGRRQPVDDPMVSLVYGFVRQIQDPDPRLDAAVRTEIHERARLYRSLVAAWPR